MRRTRLVTGCAFALACSGQAPAEQGSDRTAAQRPASVLQSADSAVQHPDSALLADSARRLVPVGLPVDSAMRRLAQHGFACHALDFGAPAAICQQPLAASPGGARLVWHVYLEQRALDGIVHAVGSRVVVPAP